MPVPGKWDPQRAVGRCRVCRMYLLFKWGDSVAMFLCWRVHAVVLLLCSFNTDLYVQIEDVGHLRLLDIGLLKICSD